MAEWRGATVVSPRASTRQGEATPVNDPLELVLQHATRRAPSAKWRVIFRFWPFSTRAARRSRLCVAHLRGQPRVVR